MFGRSLLKVAAGGLVLLSGLALPACESTNSRPEALTGRIDEEPAPRRSLSRQPGYAIGADRLRPEGRR